MRLFLVVLLAAFVVPRGQSSSPSAQSPESSQNGTSESGVTPPGPNSSPKPTLQEGQPASLPSSEKPNQTPGITSAQNSTAQTSQAANPPVLKVTTRLVLVDVVVTDGYGRPVTDLKQANFEVKENGKPQKIVAFAFQPPPPPPVPGKSAYKPLPPALPPWRPMCQSRCCDGHAPRCEASGRKLATSPRASTGYTAICSLENTVAVLRRSSPYWRAVLNGLLDVSSGKIVSGNDPESQTRFLRPG